jgi:hypothetical protein
MERENRDIGKKDWMEKEKNGGKEKEKNGGKEKEKNGGKEKEKNGSRKIRMEEEKEKNRVIKEKRKQLVSVLKTH